MENWYYNAIESISNTLNSVSMYLNNLYNTYYETINNALSAITNKFAELAQNIVEWSRPYRAIQTLADCQYVFWDYLDKEFIDTVLESKNINKTLRILNSKSNFACARDIISKCLESSHIKPYEKLFFQSVNAFEQGNNELSILGFISIIDGLLSDVSYNSTTSVYKRADAILNKIENSEAIENDDYAILSLVMTFRDTMESFSKNEPFDNPEPKILNRHWIMHGRSRRRKTKLDCIKMIRFIYAIILIDELSKKEEDNIEYMVNK